MVKNTAPIRKKSNAFCHYELNHQDESPSFPNGPFVSYGVSIMDPCQDALPIADDYENLIAAPGIDPAMLKIARRIFDVAEGAAEAGSGVMFSYDPDMSPDLLR